MAASMEMRVPFLENDLIDFGLHLPRRAKLHRNTGKWLVKQAATEVLPHDVVFARKKGFPFPTAYALGTERLLAGGMLAEFMQWPVNTEEIAELARGDARGIENQALVEHALEAIGRDDHDQTGTDANHHMRANSRRPQQALALKADEAAERCGEHKAYGNFPVR